MHTRVASCPTCGTALRVPGRTPLEAEALAEVFEERHRAAIEREKERLQKKRPLIPWRIVRV